MNEQMKQELFKIASIIEERTKNYFLKKLAQAKLLELYKTAKDLEKENAKESI